MPSELAQPTPFITPAQLLEHWQAHRRLSRRLIEIFPEDQLFTFTLGGMRPFGVLAAEMLSMAAPTVVGVASGSWDTMASPDPKTREDLLRLWDESTEQMNAHWPRIPGERFHETMNAFGMYEGRVNDLMLYVIDNEVHHRGQGYVYLRALGVEPPPFWERA